MFGIGPHYEHILLPILAFVVWYRLFVRDQKLSLLALFTLMTGIAVWLVLFPPWHPGML